MSDIALWKMALDLLLLCSLAYLGYRIAKSEGPGAKLPKLIELQASLKEIIREAQAAGSDLNRDLQSRQRDLEKVLFDLETVESRVNRAVTMAEDRKGALELTIGKANEAASASERAIKLERLVEEPEPVVEPPSFVSGHQRVAAAAKSVKTNIYGEPIAAAAENEASRKSSTRRPLAKRIEVTEQNPYSRQEVLKARLEDLYYAAEAMLRAGRDAQSVANRTKLPLEEVRMLEQMVGREKVLEQAVDQAPVVDPRLGVLAQAGRSSATAVK